MWINIFWVAEGYWGRWKEGEGVHTLIMSKSNYLGHNKQTSLEGFKKVAATVSPVQRFETFQPKVKGISLPLFFLGPTESVVPRWGSHSDGSHRGWGGGGGAGDRFSRNRKQEKWSPDR